MLKLGIMSDTHLGYQQFGLERRRQDFYRAFKHALEMLMEKDVKTILHAGDLLNSNRPDPESIRVLQNADTLLKKNGASMLVVSGNHDKTTPPWTDVLENNSSNPCGIKLLDGLLMQLYDSDNKHYWSIAGLASMHADSFKKEVQKFNTPGKKMPDLMVIHQPFKEFSGAANDDTLGISDIPAGIKLTVVGDTHITDTIHKAGPEGGQWFLSPGSTELGSASEPLEKFAHIVTLERGVAPTFEKILLPGRRVIRIDILDAENAGNDITEHISKLTAKYVKDMLKPILFIRYDASIPNVMPRFRSALDPDDYVLRFDPVMKGGGSLVESALPGGAPTDPQALLKAALETKPELYPIALQLINPEGDAHAAITDYVDGKLRAIADATSVPVV